MSVLFINHALYDFASKYCSELPIPLAWPVIELTGRTLHPILNVDEVLQLTKTSSREEFVPQLNRVVVDPRIRSAYFVVNSRGEIILLTKNKMIIIYSTGKSKDVMLPEPIETDVVDLWPRDVAVDSHDN